MNMKTLKAKSIGCLGLLLGVMLASGVVTAGSSPAVPNVRYDSPEAARLTLVTSSTAFMP